MACPIGEVIAVKEVRYGTKRTSVCALNDTSAACCQYDAGDCFDPQYTGTAELAACSGYNVCNNVKTGQEDSSSCGADYPGLNHYLVMDYYCIPDSRTGSMSIASLQETGSLLYLQNTDYPTGPIRAAETTVLCSVETTSCSSRVIIYFVHFELSDGGGSCSGTQNLQVDDKGVFHTYTCSDNTYYTIQLKLTSSSNYLVLTLNNPDGINEGKIKIGFEATENTAPIKLSCPAESQTVCMDCPALVAPANGALSTTDATTSSSVSVSCIAGFSLYGDSTLVCQTNGTWIASVGVCRQGCPGLSNPNNGAVLALGNNVNDTATYTCSTGYVLTGIATRTCQADSTWSGSEPACMARELGDSCVVPVDCSAVISNSTCDSSKCVCAVGYWKKNNACLREIAEEPDDELSVGAIAGIVICCLCVLAIATGILFYCFKRSTQITVADNQLVSNDPRGVEVRPHDGLTRIRENTLINRRDTQTPPVKFRGQL